MPKRSAGILMYRIRAGLPAVLLAHPGGPLWASKDEGIWTIPKGEIGEDEDPLEAAKREFAEELGFIAVGSFHPIGSVKQKSGKVVEAWAVQGDWNPSQIRSNEFKLEWPPRSGKTQSFPEIDRAQFFTLAEARRKIIPSQSAFLDALEELLRE